MKNYLSGLDNKFLRIIREAGKEADRKGLSAYIVGGVVRDIILKRKNLDLDIVVEGDAIRLARVLAKKWKARLTVYKQFGTACLEMSGGTRVDFATARRERYAHSGALPAVQPGTLKEDLLRRDFTINAMAIAINPNRFGRLVDEFGGLKDLSMKKIRVLHDQSFIDDPTRILRAVRFEQRFCFQIERQTLLLMRKALRKKIETNVKPPRYFAEFKKILCEENPVKALQRLHHLGGLRFLGSIPETCLGDLTRMHRRIQQIRRKALYGPERCWWLVYFMGLTAAVGKSSGKHILTRFSLTREARVSIQQSRKSDEIIQDLSRRNMLSSQVYQILKPLTTNVVLYLRVRTSRSVVCKRIDKFLTKDTHVKLQIDGKDLKRMGMVSGREMGRVLNDVLCLKIDKRVKTRREQLNAALLSFGRY